MQMLRAILALVLASGCAAFQAPGSMAGRSVTRTSSPAMGPFDFLAFGKAGASVSLFETVDCKRA